LPDQVGNGATQNDRIAKIAPKHVTDPQDILCHQTLIEPVFGDQLGPRLGRRTDPDQIVDGIARQQVDNHKDYHRD